jgi:hypothetical protein
MTAVAVKGLETEAKRQAVSGDVGTEFSTSARP